MRSIKHRSNVNIKKLKESNGNLGLLLENHLHVMLSSLWRISPYLSMKRIFVALRTYGALNNVQKVRRSHLWCRLLSWQYLLVTQRVSYLSAYCRCRVTYMYSIS